ncbi:MAG: DUF4037 domain-containing protein [Spirochaetia bacterium]
MTTRGARLAQPIVEVLSRWPGVDCVAVLQSGSDQYDPYYFLSLDVYCNGEIPDSDTREAELEGHSAFESSQVTRKDRFFVGETPIRIEYKETARFDDLVHAAQAGEPRFRDAGTYPFYRLAGAEVLYNRSDWIANIRKALADLPDEFWKSLRESQLARAEHTYADLSAAAYRNDELFFVVSAGRYIRSLAGLLFAINRRFQPSYRLLTDELFNLTQLPESFPARLETFIRQDGSMTVQQRRELAELMITSVLSL